MRYFVLTVFSATLIFSQGIWGDNYRGYNERDWNRQSTQYKQPDKTSSSQLLYEEECGSCHMAYPAALLPQRSWRKIMSTLDEHFGDNAELDSETHKTIAEYLDSSKNQSASKRLKKLHKGVRQNNTPMRITELPYFKHEHDGIPDIVKTNPKVGSLSQCNRCHKDALTGGFDEHEIFIPGYGPWDD